jgi:hypothetical protein
LAIGREILNKVLGD